MALFGVRVPNQAAIRLYHRAPPRGTSILFFPCTARAANTHPIHFWRTLMPTESYKPDLKRTDLSPVEALLVERALGEEARRDAQTGTLARIQQLTTERAQLFA